MLLVLRESSELGWRPGGRRKSEPSVAGKSNMLGV